LEWAAQGSNLRPANNKLTYGMIRRDPPSSILAKSLATAMSPITVNQGGSRRTGDRVVTES
jgi:hypothetical protein